MKTDTNKDRLWARAGEIMQSREAVFGVLLAHAITEVNLLTSKEIIKNLRIINKQEQQYGNLKTENWRKMFYSALIIIFGLVVTLVSLLLKGEI